MLVFRLIITCILLVTPSMFTTKKSVSADMERKHRKITKTKILWYMMDNDLAAQIADKQPNYFDAFYSCLLPDLQTVFTLGLSME